MLSTGIQKQQNKDIFRLNIFWGSYIILAKVKKFDRTLNWLSIGLQKQQNKDIFRLNIYWDICMNMTMNLRRIINRLSSGIQKRQNKIIILLKRTGTRC